MPQIKQYQPDPNIPGVVQMAKASPADFGAAAGQGLQQLGNDTSDAGEFLQRRQNQIEVSDMHAGVSVAAEALQEKLRQRLSSAQPGEDIVGGFEQDINDSFGKLQDSAQTNAGRDYVNKATALQSRILMNMAARGQAELAGDKQRLDLNTKIDRTATMIRNDPSSYDAQLAGYHADNDALVSNGNLTSQIAAKVEEDARKKFAIARFDGTNDAGQRGPEAARALIGSDKFQDGTLTEHELEMLKTRTYEKDAFNRTQIELQKKQQDEAFSAAQDKEKDRLFPKIFDNTIDINKDVWANQKLEPNVKLQMQELALRQAREGAHTHTDSAFFNEALDKLYAPVDPGQSRMSTSEFQDYLMNEGVRTNRLSITGSEGENFHELLNLQAGTNTPEGRHQARQESRFYDSVKIGMSYDNVNRVFKDPNGQENTNAAMAYYNQKKEEYRKAGKPVDSLTDPTDKTNYILPTLIQTFGRNPGQIMSRLNAPVGGQPTPSPTAAAGQPTSSDVPHMGSGLSDAQLKAIRDTPEQSMRLPEPARVGQILRLYSQADESGKANFNKELTQMGFANKIPGTNAPSNTFKPAAADASKLRKPGESPADYLKRMKDQ